MINFLLYNGLKIWQGRRIYFHSIDYHLFCSKICMIRGKIWEKAFFDIKENKFYNLPVEYVPILEQQKGELKESEITRKLNEVKEQLQKEREERRRAKRKEYIKNISSLSFKLFIKNQTLFNGVREAEAWAKELINKTLEEFQEKIKSDITFKFKKYLIEVIICIIKKKIDDNININQLYLTNREYNKLINIYESSKGRVKRTSTEKEADYKYNNSVKGKEAIAKYKHSAKGKEAIRRANIKYMQSSKGREARKRAMAKYKQKGKLE